METYPLFFQRLGVGTLGWLLTIFPCVRFVPLEPHFSLLSIPR